MLKIHFTTKCTKVAQCTRRNYRRGIGPQTSLILNNDLGSSSQVTFYGFPVKSGFADTTFILGSKSRIYIDSEVELGAHGLFEFGWVSNHFDSIKVVNGIRKSTKDFKKEQEWTFVKKDKSNWEYTLVIDDSDF